MGFCDLIIICLNPCLRTTQRIALTINMALNTAIEVVGVDWGTTHRRAYGLDANGQCVAEHADGEGALACKGRFAEALRGLLDTLRAQPQAVILSGMVGSALGWQVVPYVDSSVALTSLGVHLVAMAESNCAIVPGYCVRNAAGQPDVMRGEETQLLGAHCLGHGEGWFVLPGTHSKWVELRNGQVKQLRTYMTGELFDLLGRSGTLAAAAGTESVWDDAAFAQGVQAAQAGGALSHQLFGCRARVVSGDMAASSSRAYLSGLLIGTELQDVLRDATAPSATRAFKLIGSVALASHYQAAAAILGLAFDVLDARAVFIAATHHLAHHRTTA